MSSKIAVRNWRKICGLVRACPSFEPSESADQLQSDKEVARGLVVACRDTLIMLEGIEPLDEIALGVECQVASSFDLAG